jgi:hypothetical protein
MNMFLKAMLGKKGSKPRDAAPGTYSDRSRVPQPDNNAASRTPRLPESNTLGLPELSGAGPVMYVPELGRSLAGSTAPPVEDNATDPVPMKETPPTETTASTTPVAQEEKDPHFPIEPVSQPAKPGKKLILKVENIERIVQESKLRIRTTNAVSVTTSQLKTLGIHRIGLGSQDFNRIEAVNSNIEVYNGPLDSNEAEVRGLHLTHNHPSHVIDTIVLASMETEQCNAAVSIALNAFAVIRTEVKKDYQFAADYVLKAAVKSHMEHAYAGYVKILSVSNNIDKITEKRGNAIENWVLTLRDDVKKAGAVAKFIENARREAFLAGMVNQKIRKASTEEQENSEDDNDAVISE